MSDTTALIQVKQLPIIEERLQELKARWEQKAADAESMVCTEETIQAVKAFRADMRKEFEKIEALRKQVKKAVLEPYEQFEAVYKDCVSVPFGKAEIACADKVHDVESEIKRRCEEGLREYFDELCTAHGIDWLRYEQTGIKVDMASAKQKTPKKLREQLKRGVEIISADVNAVFCMEYAEEILAEYKQTLDLARAIDAVRTRHKRVEAEREALESMAAEKAAEAEAVRRVEALAPPTVQEMKTVTFTVTDTVDRLIVLREWMKANGYDYK